MTFMQPLYSKTRFRQLVVIATIPLAFSLGACQTTSDNFSKQSAQAVSDDIHAASSEKALNVFFDEFWQASLQHNPLTATYVGDARYNDQLPNFLTAEYRAKDKAFEKAWLERLEQFDASKLQGQAKLSYEIFRRDREESLEGYAFPGYLIPINQFYNFAGTMAQLGSGTSAQPFKTVKDYDDWKSRAEKIAPIFDQAIVNMKEGVSKGYVQPEVLMVKVVPQLEALIKADATETLFWKPVEKMPEDFSKSDRNRIKNEYYGVIQNSVMPAYKRLHAYIKNDYLKHTRDTVGMQGLPNGDAWYAYNVKVITTTDLTPEQIHQIGLDEVNRIHTAMRSTISKLGFKGDLQAFFKFLDTDPRFQFESEEALLAAYNALREKVDAGADKLFAVKPKAAFEIRPVEAFRAKSAAGGSYNTPSEDGTRPGIFYVNTYDLPSRKTWDMEDLYLHEAIPGHHFQLAIQQELENVPAFRRFGRATAFIEGWALYAESLGEEIGVYTDPYMYFGYLQNELWRAIRLVVDTGLHNKGWTRQQVLDYMMNNSAVSETQAVSEAERYMAIPGQALAYKIGELKIKELRAKAEKELGERFSITAFHDQILKDGALPLDLLEEKIDRWVAQQKAMFWFGS